MGRVHWVAMQVFTDAGRSSAPKHCRICELGKEGGLVALRLRAKSHQPCLTCITSGYFAWFSRHSVSMLRHYLTMASPMGLSAGESVSLDIAQWMVHNAVEKAWRPRYKELTHSAMRKNDELATGLLALWCGKADQVQSAVTASNIHGKQSEEQWVIVASRSNVPRLLGPMNGKGSYNPKVGV